MVRWMWRLNVHEFIKFGRGVREGGFTTSAATSSNEIVLSIIPWPWDCTHQVAIRFLLYSLRTVDCSKGTIAESLGQKVVLSFIGYWGKRSE
jgi:hypothetical protein